MIVPRTEDGNSDSSVVKKNWGHDAANPVASNVPRLLSRGCGGLSLRGPVGGLANGMPLKDSTLGPLDPTKVPEEMVTEGLDAAGAAWMRGRERRGRNRRRFMVLVYRCD